MKLSMEGDAAEALARNMERSAQNVRKAMMGAANIAAKEIERRGRADIAGGGNFGSAWTNAFNAIVASEEDAVTITATMGGDPPVAYWKIFEYGATISAKNPSGLMWIPFDRENKTWPRDYGGSLFRIGNALFDKQTREPMYLGTPSVTIPQKFHLVDVIRGVAKELRDYFKVSMSYG